MSKQPRHHDWDTAVAALVLVTLVLMAVFPKALWLGILSLFGCYILTQYVYHSQRRINMPVLVVLILLALGWLGCGFLFGLFR